jgi:hypothetical protein
MRLTPQSLLSTKRNGMVETWLLTLPGREPHEKIAEVSEVDIVTEAVVVEEVVITEEEMEEVVTSDVPIEVVTAEDGVTNTSFFHSN